METDKDTTEQAPAGQYVALSKEETANVECLIRHGVVRWGIANTELVVTRRTEGMSIVTTYSVRNKSFYIKPSMKPTIREVNPSDETMRKDTAV